jgi:hypothetical protein
MKNKNPFQVEFPSYLQGRAYVKSPVTEPGNISFLKDATPRKDPSFNYETGFQKARSIARRLKLSSGNLVYAKTQAIKITELWAIVLGAYVLDRPQLVERTRSRYYATGPFRRRKFDSDLPGRRNDFVGRINNAVATGEISTDRLRDIKDHQLTKAWVYMVGLMVDRGIEIGEINRTVADMLSKSMEPQPSLPQTAGRKPGMSAPAVR